MQKIFAISFIFFVLNGLNSAALAGLFTSADHEPLEPIELTLLFPFEDSQTNKIAANAQVEINYQADAPDEKGVKKEKRCQNGTSVIPSFGVCEMIAVSISKTFPLRSVTGTKNFKVTLYNKLTGSGSYRAHQAWILFKGPEDLSPFVGEFSFQNFTGTDNTIFVSNEKVSLSAILSTESELTGFSSSKTESFHKDKKDQIYFLDPFSRSVLNLPYAYIGRNKKIIFQHLPMDNRTWEGNFCYGEAPVQTLNNVKKLWPGFAKVMQESRLTEKMAYLTATGEDSNFILRQLTISLKEDLIFIETYELTKNKNSKERIILKSEKVIQYAKNIQTTKNNHTVTDLQFWIPGLESIYPEIAFAPSASHVQELKQKYRSVIDALHKAASE